MEQELESLELVLRQRSERRILVSDPTNITQYISTLGYRGELFLQAQQIKIYVALVEEYITFSVTNLFSRPLLISEVMPEINNFPLLSSVNANLALQALTIRPGLFFIRQLIERGFRQDFSGRIPVVITNFEITDLLGGGFYGSVYRANIDGINCAVKFIALNDRNMISSSFFAEVSLNLKRRQPFAMPLLGIITEQSKIGEIMPAAITLVQQKAEGYRRALAADPSNIIFPGHIALWENSLRSLQQPQAVLIYPLAGFDLIKLSITGLIKEGDHISIAYQLLKGLAIMHNEGVRHRDIKPANILIFPMRDIFGLVSPVPGIDQVNVRFRVAYGDFGLAGANECALGIGEYNNNVYSDQYRAPEILWSDSANYNDAADIWALGVTLLEVITHRRPFEGTNREQVTAEIFKLLGTQEVDIEDMRLPHYPQNQLLTNNQWDQVITSSFGITPVLKLIRRMLNINYRRRPSASQLLEDPMFFGLQMELNFAKQWNEVPATIRLGQDNINISLNPLDFVTTSVNIALSCSNKIILARAPKLPNKLQISAGEYMRCIKYIYDNIGPQSTLRTFFLATYLVSILATNYDIMRDTTVSVTKWCFAAICTARALVDVNLVEVQDINVLPIIDQQLTLLALANYNIYVSTQYEIWQISVNGRPENVRNLSRALLLFMSQTYLYGRYDVFDLARIAITTATYISNVQIGKPSVIPQEPEIIMLRDLLAAGDVTLLSTVFQSMTQYRPGQLATILYGQRLIVNASPAPEVSPIRM